MAIDHGQAVARLAGQLDYLFEERPELRGAPPGQLLDRLNREDRLSRARAEEPLQTDAWVAQRAHELEDRFTLDQIREAIEVVRKRGPA
jgi:hypothetical protein